MAVGSAIRPIPQRAMKDHFTLNERFRKRAARWLVVYVACWAGGGAVAADRWENAELTELQAVAAAGDPTAQYALGERYWNGTGGVLQDPARAVELWTAAARRMHPGAIFALGNAAALGRGVPRSAERAVALWRHAANAGHVGAMTALGKAYAAGQGVRKDAFQAVQWFQRAAAAGDPVAEYHLGWHFENGQGVEMDLTQAAICYLHAAEKGVADAQNDLGVLYANGEGVPRNLIDSFVWLSRAAAAGHPKAPANLEAVRRQMSRSERRRAQQRLEELTRAAVAE